jgi:transcriptional regulator with XRE-family HTH domain
MPARRSAKPVAASFGAELRKARINAKLTQQTVAERADVDPVFVSFLENGHRQPSLTVVLSLERVLGLSAGELVRRTARHLESTKEASLSKAAASTRRRKLPSKN